MAMPSGDSPEKAREITEYLLAHHETEGPVKQWTIHWLSLAWMWGFLAALALIALWWVWQYRSTHQRTRIYPVDRFGGYTTEQAAPATLFFILLTAVLTGFAVALVVGHLVNGQIY